jgi:hypothetical protein
MLSLPTTFVSGSAVFAPVFSKPVWQHVKVFIMGAILAPGRRTVTAALCPMADRMHPAAKGNHFPRRGLGAGVHRHRQVVCGGHPPGDPPLVEPPPIEASHKAPRKAQLVQAGRAGKGGLRLQDQRPPPEHFMVVELDHLHGHGHLGAGFTQDEPFPAVDGDRELVDFPPLSVTFRCRVTCPPFA